MKGKNILIISPQEWEHIKISKHHYALELSKNNNVFFLNPPDKKFNYLTFQKKIINENLVVVENSTFFPYLLKFHFNSLFNFLLKFHVKRIIKFCGDLDIVWSFSALYPNLKHFKAPLSIYHPVDLSPEPNFVATGKTADVIFGVTPQILNQFTHKNQHLIHHGISSDFFAKSSAIKKTDQINIAYCGNLDMKSLNTEVVIHLIKQYKDAHFHFIGPYTASSSFISEISNLENVTLYGKILPKEIAEIYKSIDIFLLCYDIKSIHSRNQGANSHKLLEYLSTGKVVVSHYIELYEKLGLIEINLEGTNDGYYKIFDNVYHNLDQYNSQENINKRLSFARKSSYEHRIKQIENHIKQFKIR